MSRAERQVLFNSFFPDGIPSLWCPALTHFSAPVKDYPAPGIAEDFPRLIPHSQSHLIDLMNNVGGLLYPGSTSEGWELSDREMYDQLTVLLDMTTHAFNFPVLIGILKTDAAAMQESIAETMTFLRRYRNAVERGDAIEITSATIETADRTNMTDTEVLRHLGVVGFTVCPPKGEHLTQAEIADALRSVLNLGLPIALYQLPQVTGNEMTPETVAALAAEYPNFLFFKDTSGRDTVVQSGLDFGGVFFLRGAEGGYARWTKAGGGPYDGLLLSSANAFPKPLSEVLRLLEEGETEAAQSLSDRIETVVMETFARVRDFPVGNPFTNANKLLTHVMAYADLAETLPMPLLHSGTRLPAEWLPLTIALLKANDLFPKYGYAIGRRDGEPF
jgi:4-hydroxy-tetrahydrodipicolinate synthase